MGGRRAGEGHCLGAGDCALFFWIERDTENCTRITALCILWFEDVDREEADSHGQA